MRQKSQTPEKRPHEAGIQHHVAVLEPRPIPFMRSFQRALIVLTVIVVAAAAWAAQDFLVPTASAIVIAMALAPVVRAVERFGLPTGAAAIVVVVLFAGIIAGAAAAITPSVSDWMKRAPEIAQPRHDVPPA